ncbi:MAG TPA: DNA polymerase III subunit delta' [Acidothermaceae bacterium]|nr:DNA polymerase III subunit delta' [Acidothermaceae bacterium]
MTVFDDLVGQERVVALLRAAAISAAEVVWAREMGMLAALDDAPAVLPDAVAPAVPGAAMTHAWLFTGPPGSGRSVAARAFAAALQCTAVDLEPGCGVCLGCHTVLAGTHADVEVVTPQGLSLGVREARELVARAALMPAGRHWQVILIEDADRLTEGAANVLLKAIEEPSPRTVWLLCVPSAQDLVITIRSRCRVVALRTPPTDAVASVLVSRDGVAPVMADFAARAAAGHVGRARRLATDASARDRRHAVLQLPSALTDVGRCLAAASDLVKDVGVEAAAVTSLLDEAETASYKEAFGEGGTATGVGRGSSGGAAARGALRSAAAALKELEGRQKSRATRTQRDALDRALTDLAGFYRDVLVVQLGAGVDIANVDEAAAISALAGSSSAESTVRRLSAVLNCRTSLEANANPLLTVEALTLALRAG